MGKKIAILPGDGIGPEVMAAALLVLAEVKARAGLEIEIEHGLIGGAAFDEHASHFPEQTRELCQTCDAILFGSVGGPVEKIHEAKWKDCEKNALLGLRKAFNFSANFRPAKVYPVLSALCPLKPELLKDGVDILIIRELLGGIYFGEHVTEGNVGARTARDVCEYSEESIKAIARIGFEAAKKRGGKLTSVDKANVLDTSRLWRDVVSEMASEYPEVTLEHMLVDNAAMQLIQRPSAFDVVLTENMFGDILSDAAAVLPGSLGLTPSASMSANGFAMYEPSGGSAQDIAGKGVANPIAQILSLAMLLRFSFEEEGAAGTIERAVEKTLEAGIRTRDICIAGEPSVGTKAMAEEIASRL